MTDELGHDIANSNGFRVASERCPERYHVTLSKNQIYYRKTTKVPSGLPKLLRFRGMKNI